MSRRHPEYRRAILIGPRVEKPRVLIMAASPPDTPPTTATREAQEISEILAKCGNGLEARLETAVSRESLPDHLRAFEPTFIHFAGHGRRGAEAWKPGPSRDIDAGLVVHHNPRDADARSVDLEDIARWIGERRGRVVLLTACHSEAIAKAAAANESVCIGFKGTLPDGQARAFARAFWKYLRFPGHTVDLAFCEGRSQMDPDAAKLAAIHPPKAGSNLYLIPKGGNHG